MGAPSGYIFMPGSNWQSYVETKSDPVINAVSDFADPIMEVVEQVPNVIEEIGTGLENAWYSLTGQTEKTSAYKALKEREDTAYQRMVQDMRAAGLSPYFASGTGNASSSSAGMGQTTGLTAMNALVDLFAKKAQIDHVEAETAHTKADTQSIVTRNGFLPDLLNLQLAEGQARVELTKNQGASVAEDILSKVSARSIAEAEHLMNMKIKSQEYNWFGLTASAKINVMQAQIENYASEVAKRDAEIYHLSKEDELLVQDLYMRSLETEIMKYNYDYSAEHGIRTTDSPTKIAGFNLDQIGQGFKDHFGFNWKEGFYFRDSKRGNGGYAW